MGTLLFAGPNAELVLEGHEGYLQFRLDEPVPMYRTTVYEGWTSTWTAEIDPHRVAVRTACECGWTGPELPWVPGVVETDEQRDALMAQWYHEHAGPLRDALEGSA